MAYTVVVPLFGIIMNLIVEQTLDLEDVTIKLAMGAVLGSIFGGLVEFVRRDKAKTESQELEKRKQNEKL